MYYLIIICYVIFGGLGVFLITYAMMTLTKHLCYVANKVETTGIVIGYEEKIRYTYQTPRRLVREYFPQIKYHVDMAEQIGIVKNTRKNDIKEYNIGSVVRIGYNRKFTGYFFLVDNHKNALLGTIPFIFGCMYIFLLNLIVIRIFHAEVENFLNILIIIIAILTLQAIRLIIMAAIGNVYSKKNCFFSLQGVIIYFALSGCFLSNVMALNFLSEIFSVVT